jgi:hypothetical protein
MTSKEPFNNVMSAAFQKAGIDPLEMTLGKAVIEFAKAGGTQERAHDVVRLAFERRLGGGHGAVVADSDQSLEVARCETVEDLRTCLIRDGALCGIRLELRRESEEGTRRITGRKPTMVTLAGIAQAALLDWTLIEGQKGESA